MGNLEALGKEAIDRQNKMFRPFPGAELQDYLTDAAQRYILFLNILRRRGDEQAEREREILHILLARETPNAEPNTE